MSKISSLLSVLVILGFHIIVPVGVHADSAVDFQPQSTDVNKIGGCDNSTVDSPICDDIDSETNPLFGPDGILTKVAGIFGLITGVISVFMMLLGGFRYINSDADPQKTATAKKTIIYAAVGVAVASIGGVLVRFVLSQLNS